MSNDQHFVVVANFNFSSVKHAAVIINIKNERRTLYFSWSMLLTVIKTQMSRNKHILRASTLRKWECVHICAVEKEWPWSRTANKSLSNGLSFLHLCCKMVKWCPAAIDFPHKNCRLQFFCILHEWLAWTVTYDAIAHGPVKMDCNYLLDM